MRAIRWVACVVAAMGVVSGAWAQEAPAAAKPAAGGAIELKVNFTPGMYVVTKDVTMHVDTAGDRPTVSQIHTAMLMDMEVSKPDEQGNRELTVTYRQIKFDQKHGDQSTTYDSSAGASAEQVPPVAKMFEGMVGKKVTVTLDSQGKVSRITGVDEMIASMLQSAGMDERAAEGLKQQFGDRIAEETFGQLLIMPGKPVSRGDSWEVDKQVELPVLGAVQYKQVLTLKDVKDGVATVAVKGTLRSVGGKAGAHPAAPSMMVNELTVEGTTLMDIATGMAKRSDVTQKGSLTLTAGEGEEKKETKITLNGTAKTTIEKK